MYKVTQKLNRNATEYKNFSKTWALHGSIILHFRMDNFPRKLVLNINLSKQLYFNMAVQSLPSLPKPFKAMSCILHFPKSAFSGIFVLT